MRMPSILIAAALLTACATTSLERQAGSAAKGDCRQQANDYVRANMAQIANEWRELEKYKHYQRCLAERSDSKS